MNKKPTIAEVRDMLFDLYCWCGNAHYVPRPIRILESMGACNVYGTGSSDPRRAWFIEFTPKGYRWFNMLGVKR